MEATSILTKVGEPVPEVAPADLKAVFEASVSFRKDHPDVKTIGMGCITRGCGPGADVQALGYRLMLLGFFVSTVQEKLAPTWISNGRPEDIVFEHAARIPMTNVIGGSSPKGVAPVDFDELLRRICGTAA